MTNGIVDLSFYLFVTAFFKIIEVYLVYNVVFNFYWTAKWQLYIYFFFHILFLYGLSQDIKYSSRYCRVGHCCLSTLYIIVCISNLKLPTVPPPCLFPLGNHKSAACFLLWNILISLPNFWTVLFAFLLSVCKHSV